MPTIAFDMMKDILLDYWHELRSRRSDWAFRAYDRLVSTLSKDVREKLQVNKDIVEPYIVIFGKTQVGKTTLLLDLLGIEHEQMGKISQVLRGGRDTGKSATATAMEYCCSGNDRWGLTLESNTDWFVTDKELTMALGKLRDEMESGQLIASSPCVVHIPKRFFVSTDRIINVRILDLPGDNPANAVEQKHVAKMAQTYLPFADMVLLVGKGDDLGFLRPEVITLPGIEDWQAMPQRFRIVTTYSYSAKSVKDLLRNDESFDTTQIRQRLIQQIELFGRLSDEAKDSSLYFPLEFGASWKGLMENEPELYHRVEPIIGSLRKELVEQIYTSVSPIGRLRNILNTHISIRYIRKKNEEAIISEISKLASEEKANLSDISVWEKSIKILEEKLLRVDAILNESTRDVGEVIVTPHFNNGVDFPPSVGKEDDLETLRTLIRDYYWSLKGLEIVINHGPNTSSKYWKMLSSRVIKPEQSIIQSILDDAFESIRRKIDDYLFDTYWISSNYRSDLEQVRNSGKEAIENLVELWLKSWIEARIELDKEFKSKIHILKLRLNSILEERENAYKRLKQVKLIAQRKSDELKRNTHVAEEDLERCDRFVQILEQEYLAALTKQMVMAFEEKDDCNSLIQILSCIDLISHREDLMILSEKKTD